MAVTVGFGLDWSYVDIGGTIYRHRQYRGDVVWQMWVKDEEVSYLGRWEYCEEPEDKR